MAKRKPQKGTLNWCIKQAAAYGVSYGTYMAEYYKKDMRKEQENAARRISEIDR